MAPYIRPPRRRPAEVAELVDQEMVTDDGASSRDECQSFRNGWCQSFRNPQKATRLELNRELAAVVGLPLQGASARANTSNGNLEATGGDKAGAAAPAAANVDSGRSSPDNWLPTAHQKLVLKLLQKEGRLRAGVLWERLSPKHVDQRAHQYAMRDLMMHEKVQRAGKGRATEYWLP